VKVKVLGYALKASVKVCCPDKAGVKVVVGGLSRKQHPLCKLL
jgi:hypothetical protein